MALQSWGDLYQELAKKIQENIPAINWVDLWHNQVGFLVDQHPFPTPAVFIAFRILNIEDYSENAQKVTLQIDFYYFYETFLDTYSGAYNQADALNYLEELTAIYKVFHGSYGVNYSEMRRTGLNSVDTGSAGNLYKQTFTCITLDASAMNTFNNVIPGDVIISEGSDVKTPKEKLFVIP